MADLATEMTDDQWRAWTCEHKACYEVRPLMHKRGDQLVQVGFEFEIAVRLLEKDEGGPREQATREVLGNLAYLTKRVFPVEGDIARFELAPFQPVAQLRKETGFQPEVRRVVQIYHKRDYLQSVADGDRQRLNPLERQLQELGVKAGSW